METNAPDEPRPTALDEAGLGSAALSFAQQARQFTTMAALAARLHEVLAPLGITAASANPFQPAASQ